MARRKSKARPWNKNKQNVPGNIPVNSTIDTNSEWNTNSGWTQTTTANYQHVHVPLTEVTPICKPEDRGRYGPKESRERLESQGYHPLVTSMTKEEVEASYEEKRKKSLDKPDFIEYACEGKEQGFEGRYTSDKNLLIKASESSFERRDETPELTKEVFNGTHPQGLLIAQHLASLGIKQLEKLALARPREWDTLSKGMAIWDFTTKSFHGEPSGHVFLCLFPKISQGAFSKSPAHKESRREEKLTRKNIVKQIRWIYFLCGPTELPAWHPEEKLKIQTEGPSAEVWRCRTTGTKPPLVVINMARSIPDISKLDHMMRDYVDQPKHLDYYMSKQVALKNMFGLLTSIFNRRTNIRVLHFQKTPLLDRRLVACILRACPHITTLGIYQCPLIHFGDVICLLDLIHEVNLNRSSQSLPLVEALDFYPLYHAGMPFKLPINDELTKAEKDRGMEPAARETHGYGITWTYMPNEVLQRGVFAILLKTVLKTRKMGIRLLMDKDAAFMKYLSDIPMLPGIIFQFLDGLYRYLDLKEAGSEDNTAMKRAKYDMILAVHAGLQSPYRNTLDPSDDVTRRVTSLFCSSCGYKMLDIFFCSNKIGLPPHRRTCAGCEFQACLDKQSDHQKHHDLNLMGRFLEKDWDPKGFNVDAPVHDDGQELLFLHTRKTTNDLPLMVLLPNGEFDRPSFQEQLICEHKENNDCLQGLPTLQSLLLQKDAEKADAKDHALHVDACRALSIIMNHHDFELAMHDKNHGVGGHFCEGQGWRPLSGGFRDKGVSHTFESATKAAEDLKVRADIAEGRRPEQDAAGFW
ncbi:hypothetical protein FOPG_00303 [Fusarium oxysporum f. sp. conglutinans race 2 54008]|uniref:Uncharacterized protein n=3 Tax=Fusarium oxysporum f. sp. conglutinans TaxID=100902 RepID=A0A8H6LT47_FUSOX|nr:hypothetical protein FOXB_12059 [Fusarium oxysporum f. sp. conglutinans Fo5176]EXL89712.1 hypothetical protein FOPG_00303 [Fusarium oxysporum f. sp. conglutinans race 2 54008]KAF6529880.1 hypothetical protein HZS61_001192 [Fusarium oxysporum f. sp. conglutinans]KAG6992182.1 hypothetical protein FocnCong_v018361 [Fusarium oxysporum f. sp. conglutinans]KAI8418270.1 hypothetical protein FOFC_00836 [Fusarium oxysporum]